jgi:hypothetical protein
VPALAHKLAWLKCPFHRSPQLKAARTAATRPELQDLAQIGDYPQKYQDFVSSGR